jgi:hypothetical protein
MKLAVAAAFVALPVMGFAQDAQDGPRQGMMAGGRMVRGTVTAAAADKLTVKTDEGETYQVVLSANTRLTKDRQPVKVADIKVGDGVGAMGVLDQETKTVHALFVGVIDAEQVKKVRENMGKTYITGKVTAIDMDGLKITVMRPDNVSQVIGVDENTSFKRGGRGMAALASGAGVVDAGPSGGRPSGTGAGNGQGMGSGSSSESITLADVKVGDSIAGRGAVKNGVFLPTELGVVDPGVMRQRRKGAEGGTAGSTAGSTTPPASPTAPKAPATPTTPQ